jgi:hypothetical protein
MLYNEVLRGNYRPEGIFRLVKRGRLRLAGHIAKIGKIRGAYKMLQHDHLGSQEERETTALG